MRRLELAALGRKLAAIDDHAGGGEATPKNESQKEDRGDLLLPRRDGEIADPAIAAQDQLARPEPSIDLAAQTPQRPRGRPLPRSLRSKRRRAHVSQVPSAAKSQRSNHGGRHPPNPWPSQTPVAPRSRRASTCKFPS